MTTASDDNLCILVVEDVEWIRDGIVELLQTSGCHVEAARDEREAVAKALHKHPDLILVSLGQSPDDEVAVGDRIRERADAGDAAVVVLAYTGAVEEGGEVALARNVYLIHPDNFDQLRDLLNRLLH